MSREWGWDTQLCEEHSEYTTMTCPVCKIEQMNTLIASLKAENKRVGRENSELVEELRKAKEEMSKLRAVLEGQEFPEIDKLLLKSVDFCRAVGMTANLRAREFRLKIDKLKETLDEWVKTGEAK